MNRVGNNSHLVSGRPSLPTIRPGQPITAELLSRFSAAMNDALRVLSMPDSRYEPIGRSGGGAATAAAFYALAGTGNRWLTAKMIGADGQPVGTAFPVLAMSYGRAGLHRQIDLSMCNPVLDPGDLIWIAPLSLIVDGTTFAWGCVAPTFRAIGCAGG